MYYVSLATYTSKFSIKSILFLFIVIDADKSVSIIPIYILIFHEVFDRPL